MKYSIFIISIVSVVLISISCNKIPVNIDERYYQFVGDWIAVDGEVSINAEIDKSGQISVHRVGQRSFTMQVNELFDSNQLAFNGLLWEGVSCSEIERNGNTKEWLTIYYRPNKDTICLTTRQSQDAFQFFDDLTRFVRK